MGSHAAEVARTAIVTGGGSGIGLAVTRALLERGFGVAICGRDAAKLDRAAAALTAVAPRERLYAAPADVSQAADVRRFVSAVRERLGPPELLVLNAAVAPAGDVLEFPEEAWDEVLAVNLKGPFLFVKEVVPLMRERGGGYVVSISSLAGKKGMPGNAPYSASKFGLVGFTEALLREEAKHGIRATSICPGFVATPMVAGAPVPEREMIQPEDVAKTILYLLDLSPVVVIREIVVERVGAL